MVRVVMMGHISLDGWKEKNMNENDQDEADGMKQEVDSKDCETHIEMNDLWILERKMRKVERW